MTPAVSRNGKEVFMAAKKKRSFWSNLIIFLCVVVIFGCIVALIVTYYPDYQSIATYKDVQENSIS